MAKPVAVKDTNFISVFDADGVVTGNVLSNDVPASEGGKLFLRFLDGERVSDSGKGGFDNIVVGKYGTFEIFENGSYSYKLNLNDPDVAALRASGKTLQETVSYKVSDGAGNTDFDTLTIDIAGTNTKPVAVDDSANVTTTSPSVSGNVLLNDIDPEGGLAVSRVGAENLATPNPNDYAMKFVGGDAATDVVGKYGTLSMKADGSYTYAVDLGDPDFIALGGAAATETFQYRVKDSAFGSGLDNSETTDVAIIQIGVNTDTVIVPV